MEKLQTSKLLQSTVIGDLKEDEYFGQDNLPYCSKCNSPRFGTYQMMDGQIKIFRCNCECKVKEMNDRRRTEEEKIRLENFRSRQRLTMIGSRYLDATFDKCIITDHNSKVLSACQNYCSHAKQVLKDNIGLYIVGDNSSGKTYAIACMCNELTRLGYSCEFTNVSRLVAEIQASYRGNGLNQIEILDKMSSVQFLFIDDIGKEFLGRETNHGYAKNTEKILLEVLNVRANNNLPIIFTSNYTLSELANNLSLDKAILERINEMSTKIYTLTGDDFRVHSLKEKQKKAQELGL